jgi:hypothetical protein
MKLLRFRVTNFRSVDDSGWINATDVTALIGTNESGKTNLLVPLWKLNPAGEDGAIDLLADAPRRRYHDLRAGDKQVPFIEAQFEVSETVAKKLANLSACTVEEVRLASVTRQFDGRYIIRFPNESPLRELPVDEVRPLLDAARGEIVSLTALKSEEGLKSQILSVIDSAIEALRDQENVDGDALSHVKEELSVVVDGAPKTSTIAPRFAQLQESVDTLLASVTRPAATSVKAARDAVLAALPKFVYYSNYGNLDSEIYLPHVIENMEREGLGNREAAKARTLKVLFQFVRLKPEEILELGQDFKSPQNREPTETEVAVIARKKKERDVLLQSASTELTAAFRDWWKQGEYRFRFQADGDHFRIWVSDDKRPEDIELEGRSTGLQWFLSFYLIFLVESQDAHEGAILLLDEPGLSLHPLAQRNLSEFFENLSTDNQLLYTTHSPFLVDPDHLDRVKAVYVNADGTTGVSSDLRAGEKDPAQTRSIYPVHAALGLSVSDTLLTGSDPVIVEGISDQFYLSAVKTLLIAAGRVTPAREMVFVPAGGVRGVKAVAGILAGKDSEFPKVLLDGDAVGVRMAADLRTGFYSGSRERVIDLSSEIPMQNAEIEDIMPSDVMVQVLTRVLRTSDEDFADVYDASLAVIPQAEAFAKKHAISLDLGWKVEVAKQVKVRLLKAGAKGVAATTLDTWTKLFEKLTTSSP